MTGRRISGHKIHKKDEYYKNEDIIGIKLEKILANKGLEWD
jgi:hypothetical protein